MNDKINFYFSCPPLVGGLGEKRSNPLVDGTYTQWFQQDRIYSSNYISMCLPAAIPGGSYMYMIIKNE